MSREICSFSDHFSAWFKKLLRHDWGKKHKKWNRKLQAANILLMVMILLPLKIPSVMWLFIFPLVLGEEFAPIRKCCYWLEDCLPDLTGYPAIWFSITMMKRRRGKYWQVSGLFWYSCLDEFKNMVNQIRHFIDLFLFRDLFMYHKGLHNGAINWDCRRC